MADVEDSAEMIAAKLTEAQRAFFLGGDGPYFLSVAEVRNLFDKGLAAMHSTPLGLEVRQVLLSNQPPTTMGGESHG